MQHLDWIARLIAAAREGLVLDLAPGVDLDATQGAAWPAAQQIPGVALRAALLTPNLAADPRGLRIRGANITGDLDLAYAKIFHPLHLTACRFDQALDWSNLVVDELTLDHSAIRSLNLDGAEVKGGLFAASLAARGAVHALDATVGGEFSLTGANLSNEGGDALSLDRVDVKGGLFAVSLTARGAVRAVGSTVGGQLVLTGANLSNEGGEALNLDGADVKGGLSAASLTARGEVRALGATVGRQLVLTGADLSNEGGDALCLDRVEVKGGLFAASLTARGEVRALGATVGGEFSLKGANLTNEGGDALSLDGAEVKGALFAASLTARGEVRALGATVGGHLVLTGATLTNEGRTALDLESASVRILVLRPAKIDGGINLTAARIELLDTPPQEMVGASVRMPGWRVGDVHGNLRHDRKAAARWLNTSPGGPVAQPWQELANVYDRNGQPADARWLRVRVAWRITRAAPWPTRVLRTFYGILTGHGYHPLLAALWLAVAAVLTYSLIANQAAGFIPSPTSRAAYAAPAAGPAGEPRPPITGATPCGQLQNPGTCFRPELFALDNVLPGTLATGQASDWRAVAPTWLPWTLICLKMFGWAMVVILLAGITGLLRKT